MEESLSVLICDDHALISEALAHVLWSEPGFTVETAGDKAKALDRLRGGGFDVVLLDINMPGMGGLDGVADVLSVAASARIIIFSGTVVQDFVTRAVELGAAGFIPKTMPMRALASAVRLVRSGQTFVPMEFRGTGSQARGSTPLSLRERAVLGLLTGGKTNKEIGLELGLTEVTVKMHVRAICNKLGAKNRTQAAMVAQRQHML
ncbi:MAG: response regulator transcription factor [Rhodobacterales bacterium]|nr:response regulator transcription factor [Rhodobacterales bacterium]